MKIPVSEYIHEETHERLLKLIGLRWRNGNEYRFNWGEINTSGEFSFAFALCLFGGDDPHYSLHVQIPFFNLFVNLRQANREPDGMMEKWGFSVFFDDQQSIHLNWGRKYKITNLPWRWSHYCSWVMNGDSQWIRKPSYKDYKKLTGGDHEKRWTLEKKFDAEHEHKMQYPYRYVCRNGDVQNVTATISVGMSERRWHWFKWLPFPRKRTAAIDIEFSEPIGEDIDGWKGGTYGCGYIMLPGETPQETLQRMERVRKFR